MFERGRDCFWKFEHGAHVGMLFMYLALPSIEKYAITMCILQIDMANH